jgi:AAA family ATP:ADP antiporter
MLTLKQGEAAALMWAFLYFFSLLCGYYIIRPMRDEMGIAGGVDKLQWLFSGTFAAMLAAVPLFGWLTRRYAPRQFLIFVYAFFISNLLVFFVLFKSALTDVHVARIFFIWSSVFNLFIVSVFWSFMTDIFNADQAKRLFGIIAAGGTAGALTGPALTAVLVVHTGPTNLLLVSALFLTVAALCVQRLVAWRHARGKAGVDSFGAGRGNAHDPGKVDRSIDSGNDSVTDSIKDAGKDAAVGGGVLAGIRLVFTSTYLSGICLMIFLFSSLATFLYFQQAHIIRDRFDDPALRTALFAGIDFAVNALTLILQLFLTGRIIDRLGLGRALALIPVLLGAGFMVMGFAPLLGVLVVVQVLRRAGNYAITRPGREMLYVVLTKEEKYKAKNFIDTVVYRGGDALSAWLYAALQGIGLTLSAIAFVAVPMACLWAWVSYRLGHRQAELAADEGDGRAQPV